MKLFILFALVSTVANAGFCDMKSASGWHCDGATTRKYCSCTLDCDRRRMSELSEEDKLEVQEATEMNDKIKSLGEEADTNAFLELLEQDGATAGRQLSYRSRSRYYSRFSRRSVSCKWKCDKGSEYECALGCDGGHCKQANAVCGTSSAASWKSSTSQKCAAVFGGTTTGELGHKQECMDATQGTGDAAICPIGDPKWGMPAGYIPWKDKQDSAASIDALLEASALDAQWFRDVLYRRMYLPIDTKPIKANLTHPLYNDITEIETKLGKVKAALDKTFNDDKHNFISFSCLRNIPECKTSAGKGKGDTDQCISQCLKVSASVKKFQATCELQFNNTDDKTYTALSFVGGKPNDLANNQLFACRPLGFVKDGAYVVYERDCKGDNPAAEFPGLCVEFQNDEIARRAAAASGSTVTPIFGLTAVAATLALFLTR